MKPKDPLQNLTDYAARHLHARAVPQHLLAPAERDHAAATFQPADSAHNSLAQAIGRETLDYLNQPGNSYAERRKVHAMVEQYLADNALYPKLQDRMAGCRMSGQYGYRPAADGSVNRAIAWDHKCGLVRLCPDEARQEQRRIARRYVSPIDDWRNKSRLRRVQQAVLTCPHVEPADLHRVKRELMKRTRKWIKAFPQIKGALVSQEDPLAADHRFHVHQNVILLVDGFFNWQAARLEWYELTRDLFPQEADRMRQGWNTYFSDKTDQADLRRAVNELVKYQVKFVSTEMLDPKKAKAKKSAAPPLTEWPPDLFTVWWEAGYGEPAMRKDGKMYRPSFRRTRSYGVLLALEALYWHDIMSRADRAHMLWTLGADPALADVRWRKLPKGVREKLKVAIALQERPPKAEEVTWCGRIRYDRKKGIYTSPSIILTQADKSPAEQGKIGRKMAEGGQGPPINAERQRAGPLAAVSRATKR